MQNKRGRPPTGQDAVSAIRLPHKLTAAVDDWAAHNGATSRSEAIRRLVELGLAASHPLQRRSFEAALKALDLASQQIDKLIDPSTSDEERKTRKQRPFLKGRPSSEIFVATSPNQKVDACLATNRLTQVLCS